MAVYSPSGHFGWPTVMLKLQNPMVPNELAAAEKLNLLWQSVGESEVATFPFAGLGQDDLDSYPEAVGGAREMLPDLVGVFTLSHVDDRFSNYVHLNNEEHLLYWSARGGTDLALKVLADIYGKLPSLETRGFI